MRCYGKNSLGKMAIGLLALSLMIWLMPAVSRGENIYTVSITAPDGTVSSFYSSGNPVSMMMEMLLLVQNAQTSNSQ